MNLINYIKQYPNVIPQDLCDKLIHNEHIKNNLFRARIRDGQEDPRRNCYNYLITHDDFPELDDELHSHIGKLLQQYTDDIETFQTGLTTEDTGYIFLMYKGEEKGEYKEHTDHSDFNPRVLSISLILNDNYDGGDFCFFNKELIIKKEKRSAIVFPSNFCFPHSISPVTKGERYAIVTWVR